MFGTEDKLALYTGKVRNGREFESFRRDCPGKTIVIQSEYDEGLASARALLGDPVAGPIIRRLQHQVVLQWEYDGVPCASGIEGERGGIDCLDRETGTIWDVKSTNDVEPQALSRHAIRRCGTLSSRGSWTGVSPAFDGQRAGLICVESSPLLTWSRSCACPIASWTTDEKYPTVDRAVQGVCSRERVARISSVRGRAVDGIGGRVNMGRSGYGECDDDENIGYMNCYRANVDRALSGKRGQAFLREMAGSLDAMPVKQLISGELVRSNDQVCAMGAVAVSRQIDVS